MAMCCLMGFHCCGLDLVGAESGLKLPGVCWILRKPIPLSNGCRAVVGIRYCGTAMNFPRQPALTLLSMTDQCGSPSGRPRCLGKLFAMELAGIVMTRKIL